MALREDDIEQLKQMIQGDGVAFRHIYERYQGLVFSFALSLTKSTEVARDMTQEVFIRLWEKRALVDATQNFSAYLKTITHNHVVNYLVKANRDRTYYQKLCSDIAHLSQLSPDILIEKELGKAYAAAVEALPPQKKIIFRLSREEGLTYEQIADQLGLSPNTVRNHMTEAIKSVRSHVRDESGLGALLLAIYLSSHP